MSNQVSFQHTKNPFLMLPFFGWLIRKLALRVVLQSLALAAFFYFLLGQVWIWIGLVIIPVIILFLLIMILIGSVMADASIILDSQKIVHHQRLSAKEITWSGIEHAEVINSHVWPNILLLKGEGLSMAINFNLIPKRQELVRLLKERIPSGVATRLDWARIE